MHPSPLCQTHSLPGSCDPRARELKPRLRVGPASWPGTRDGHLTDEYLSLSLPHHPRPPPCLSAPFLSWLYMCVWSPGARVLIDLGVAPTCVAPGCLLEPAGSWVSWPGSVPGAS